MSTLAERAKKLGLWDADLPKLFDRVEQLQELLDEAYADADEVLRPRVAQLEARVDELEKELAKPEPEPVAQPSTCSSAHFSELIKAASATPLSHKEDVCTQEK